MHSEVTLFYNKPKEGIGDLYKGPGSSCIAYRAIRGVLFNLLDVGMNTQNNSDTGIWKDKEQSRSLYGISVTISKSDLMHFIGLCGTPICDDIIQDLPDDKEYMIFAEGD
jgi:hypothetical protein